MEKKIIPLSDGGRVKMTAFLHENSPELPGFTQRPAVIVVPGGGYAVLAFREGEPVALSFLAQGFNVFLLEYSIGRYAAFPQPVIDGALAVKTVRENHEEYGVHPDKIAVCGFSAGGHLCACLSAMYALPDIYMGAEATPKKIMPDAAVLCYPCIIADMKGMGDMYRSIMPGIGDDTIAEQLSADKFVGVHTPPTFIFHTFSDNTVPVEHSLKYAAALAASDIPFELHVFPEGVHALALATFQTSGGIEEFDLEPAGKWFSLAADWLWRRFGKPENENLLPEFFRENKRARIGIPKMR